MYGFAEGVAPVPGCPGLELNVASPQVAGEVIAGPDGKATLTSVVPAAASDRTLWLQAVALDSCAVTNVVRFTFD